MYHFEIKGYVDWKSFRNADLEEWERGRMLILEDLKKVGSEVYKSNTG